MRRDGTRGAGAARPPAGARKAGAAGRLRITDNRTLRGVSPMEAVFHELRYAVRKLMRTPAFTAAVLITLGLSVGANTAAFSVVEGVLLRPLPFAEAERLVDVKPNRGTSSFQEYEAWRSAPRGF